MSQQAEEAAPRSDVQVVAAFPLAILESIRAHDRPGEVLEDEDLSISMPRRLGLTGVVDTQIRRYEAARDAGRRVRLEEVMSLVQLVLRRADAEPILREAGQRLARWHFRRTPAAWQRLLHRAPAALALRSARRAAARALRTLRAGDGVEVAAPFAIRVTRCALAAAPESAAGCVLLTAMFEEQLLLYTGEARWVVHTQCGATGDGTCHWDIVS